MKNAWLIGAVLAVVVATSAGCRSRPQSNWRTPAPGAAPMACTTDDECGGGRTCGIELGATQGTCSHASGHPGLLGGDGGAPPPRGPDTKPSPSDIQI
jgi:hypothetical protein